MKIGTVIKRHIQNVMVMFGFSENDIRQLLAQFYLKNSKLSNFMKIDGTVHSCQTTHTACDNDIVDSIKYSR